MAAIKLTAAEEEAIIKQRYLTQMTVRAGQLPLKVLMKKYLALIEAVDKGNEAEVARQEREFLRELSQTELHAKRLRAIIDANKREQDSYNAKQGELEEAIQQTQQAIEDKKLELKHAKEVKDQNLQYEVLRDLIMSQPSREVTQRAIDGELRQMEAARQEEARIGKLMELRRKQFSLLFYCIEELTRAADVTPDELAALDAMEVDAS